MISVVVCSALNYAAESFSDGRKKPSYCGVAWRWYPRLLLFCMLAESAAHFLAVENRIR